MEEAKGQDAGGDAEMLEEEENDDDEEQAEDDEEQDDDDEEEEEAGEEDEPTQLASDDCDDAKLNQADMEALLALLHPTSHMEQSSTAVWLPIDRACLAVGVEKSFLSGLVSRQMVCSLKAPGRNRRRMVAPDEIRRFMIKRMNKRHRQRLLNFMRRGRRTELLPQQHPSTSSAADAVLLVDDATLAKDAHQAGIEVRRVASDRAEALALSMIESTIDGDMSVMGEDAIEPAL